MTAKNALTFLLLASFAVILASCGGDNYVKSPLDEVIRDLPRDKPFTIILYDMDTEGSFFTTYKHQYQIIKENEDGEIKEEITDWKEVGEREFDMHIDNMGMEIASRDSTGNLTKEVAPPGYSNYVGNPRYGHWQTNSSGSSFWAFYGQYAFMSSMFRMSMYPVPYGYYDTWRGSYYGTGRPYYGPSGSRYYGTGSGYSRTANPSSSWNSRSQSFRDKVRNRVSRSSSRSGTTSRSKSGGFGK